MKTYITKKTICDKKLTEIIGYKLKHDKNLVNLHSLVWFHWTHMMYL